MNGDHDVSTAKAVEAMSDVGDFEILATRSLRELEPDCKAIAHFGVNSEGKPIKNRVDGFCLVPASRPHRYVMTTFTTTGRGGLKDKWLRDGASKPAPSRGTPSDDGDLVKACQDAERIRAEDEGAEFVVYLCTNRILDEELMTSAYAAARERRVEARFLDQSRLRDFLDASPAGQWLRQEHLGIEADQMSPNLLGHLSRESLRRYEADLLLESVEQIVPTGASAIAEAHLWDSGVSLHLLVGPSGAGKSVIGRELIRREVSDCRHALRLSGEVVQRAASLSEAVEESLRQLHPRLARGVGAEVLREASLGSPLLLVVDDINSSQEPLRLLQKVVTWSRPVASAGAEAAPSSHVRVVCPLWQTHWRSARTHYDSLRWIRAQAIGPMGRAEAVACLRCVIGEQEGFRTTKSLEETADRLGNDPILLGLFGRLVRENAARQRPAEIEDVLGAFVEQKAGVLAVEHRRPSVEFTDSLRRLARECLSRRNLRPTWTELRDWLSQESNLIEPLRLLVSQGHLCQVIDRGDGARFEFRHDRLLEYHLAAAAEEMLRGDDRESLTDPFFVSTVGRALGRAPFSADVLSWVQASAPVGLVAAAASATSDTPYLRGLAQRAGEWLAQARAGRGAAWSDACQVLAMSRSPLILQMTEGLDRDTGVREARLLSGDALAGALRLRPGHLFYPAVHDSWFEGLLMLAQERHRVELVEGVRRILEANETDAGLCAGALSLAGYLGAPELEDAIGSAWQRATDKKSILVPAMWAAARCVRNHPRQLFAPMLDAIRRLPKAESNNVSDERSGVLMELGQTTRHGFRDEAVTYLVEQGEANDEMRYIVLSILGELDHPSAARFTARTYGEARQRAKVAGGINPWAEIWPLRRTRGNGGARIAFSRASVDALAELWRDTESPEWLRDYAFGVWAKAVEGLDELARIQVGHPCHEGAIWERAFRGDREVIPEVLKKLPGHWFNVVPRVWSREFEAVIHLAFTTPKAGYDLPILLRDIPRVDGERILEEHWHAIDEVPELFQAALYIGTPKTVELAERWRSSRKPSAVSPFKYLSFYFGFMTTDLRDRLEPRHLDVLKPYLELLDENTIADMVDYCRRFGPWEWATTILAPECRRRAGLSDAADGGAESYLGRVSRQWFPTDAELAMDLDAIEAGLEWIRAIEMSRWWEGAIERGDPRERPGRILKGWLQAKPTRERASLVGASIGEHGSREDLSWLLELRLDSGMDGWARECEEIAYAVRRRTLS